ncbi:MAG TPA: hypothetical protein EYF95_03345 [Flavobacteriales bacterium]|jgi:hypothetical protein|nr:hypothetical protein [Flavobacteriales bacterium]
MSALQNLPANLSYLSPVGFKFSLANFPEVTYFCQAANIPGISLSTIPIPLPYKDIEEPGDTVSYEELTIRFIIDENMKNWLSIYDWITALGFSTPEHAQKRQILKNNMELKTDAVLTVLTSNMNAQMNFKFFECFPLNLSSISFDAAGTDIDYVVADVSFRYDLYEIENLLNNETSYIGKPVNRNA